MYRRMEEKFKKKSMFHRDNKFFVFYCITCLITVITLVSIFSNSSFVEILMIVTVVAFWPLIYLIIMIRSLLKKQSIRWMEPVRSLRDLQNSVDMKILIDILYEEKLYTKTKLQEMLRHYQSVLPRKSYSDSGFFLAIISVVTAVCMLFLSTYDVLTGDPREVVLYVWLIVVLLIAIIWLGKYVAARILQYGNFESRMEELISEIYLNYPEGKKVERKPKAVKAVISSENPQEN